MNKEKQRIAIAEACGWTNVHKFNKWLEGGPMSDGGIVGDFNGVTRLHVPDYLNDLNAMHEAENWLRGQGVIWVDYENRITKCATAAQRAEAFLRALNLWEESQ